MSTASTSGKCRLCDRAFGKGQITNHLKSCWKEHIGNQPKPAKGTWFHLVAEGSYAPEYWLHLQASAKSTMGDLDGVLRRIWLECCGHMSAFSFPVKRAPRRPRGPFEMMDLVRSIAANEMMDFEDEDALMGKSLGSKLKPGVVFSHEYDFGSTTKLALRVVAEYDAPALKGAIKVLARNEPPEVLCEVCQKPATQLCLECGYDGDFGLCAKCARKHDCGEEMLIDLVNSPRTGVCGYTGPSVEP